MADTDKARGLYRKYAVRRLRDPARKHAYCDYFVLDLHHDPHAVVALRAYAVSCARNYPQLAADLRNRASEADAAFARLGVSCG